MISNNVFSTAGDSDGSIPTDFSIIPETENEILLKDALDDVLERYYSNIDDLPVVSGACFGLPAALERRELKGYRARIV